MASGREIIPIGEVAIVLYDDMSMNGLNVLASPIVVEFGHRERLTAEMPERAFYIYAPQFYWTVAMEEKDRLARFVVENIAHE